MPRVSPICGLDGERWPTVESRLSVSICLFSGDLLQASANNCAAPPVSLEEVMRLLRPLLKAAWRLLDDLDFHVS